jgi:hypothetical protein
MDHFGNSVGPARRPGMARPANGSVPLRTPQLPFILESSVGVVTRPRAADRGIGIPFPTATDILFSIHVQIKSLVQ